MKDLTPEEAIRTLLSYVPKEQRKRANSKAQRAANALRMSLKMKVKTAKKPNTPNLNRIKEIAKKSSEFLVEPPVLAPEKFFAPLPVEPLHTMESTRQRNLLFRTEFMNGMQVKTISQKHHVSESVVRAALTKELGPLRKVQDRKTILSYGFGASQ